MTLAYSPYHRQPCFLSPITPQPYSVALILPSFPPPLAYTNQCADPTVLLPLLHPFAHAATTGTIFCFTRLSAAKSACHDYMNVFPASHCRTYYNTKLLQLSASSWLLPLCCLYCFRSWRRDYHHHRPGDSSLVLAALLPPPPSK